MARALVNQPVDQSPMDEDNIIRGLVSQVVDLLIYIPDTYVTEELVNFLLKNITKPKAEYNFILHYIDKNPVFLVPTIWRLQNVSKQHVYKQIGVLKKLNIVKKTKYKVEPPAFHYSGQRPLIYTVTGIDLTGSFDPRIDEARSKYYDEIRKSYNQSSEETVDYKQEQLTNIVNQVVDQYSQLFRFGALTPGLDLITAELKIDSRLKGLDQKSVFTLAKQIHNKLSNRRSP